MRKFLEAMGPGFTYLVAALVALVFLGLAWNFIFSAFEEAKERIDRGAERYQHEQATKRPQ